MCALISKNEVFEEFSVDVKKAFLKLTDEIVCCDKIRETENGFIIRIDNNTAFERNLVLHKSLKSKVKEFECFDFSEMQLSKEDNGYKLILSAENYESGISENINIIFDNATVEINIYRADRGNFEDNPWETLAFMAINILEKEELGKEYFNEEEKRIIPLLKELQTLTEWSIILNKEFCGFSILKEYAENYGLKNLAPLFDKAEKKFLKNKNVASCLLNLNYELNRARCEALWRDMYNQISLTQEGYPEKISLYNQQDLEKVRNEIEEDFYKMGYEGKYPTFYKNGKTKGIKLSESYGLSYFIINEKRARYVILCKENFECDVLRIQFICGTAFLKKGENVKDIYSCCFNKKGKTFFKIINCLIDGNSNLENFTIIASKRAECKKLTKGERAVIAENTTSFITFFPFFAFYGAISAIMFPLMFALMSFILLIIIDGFYDAYDFLLGLPWWQISGAAFVGFGIPMSVVDYLAKNK